MIPQRRSGIAIAIGIVVAAMLISVIPAVLVIGSVDSLLGYGWPGPYLNHASELNAGEELLGLWIVAVPTMLILVGAGVGVGVVARRAGFRPIVSGVTCAALLLLFWGALAPLVTMTPADWG